MIRIKKNISIYTTYDATCYTFGKYVCFRVTGLFSWEFTDHQRPVTRRFDVFFDLRLNELLGK